MYTVIRSLPLFHEGKLLVGVLVCASSTDSPLWSFDPAQEWCEYGRLTDHRYNTEILWKNGVKPKSITV